MLTYAGYRLNYDNNGPRRDKTCIRGFDIVKFKPVYSATETSQKIEIALGSESRYDTFQCAKNIDADQSVRMRRLVCAFVFRKPWRQVFLRRCPYACKSVLTDSTEEVCSHIGTGTNSLVEQSTNRTRHV